MRQYRGRIKDSTVWVYGYYTKSPQGIARIWSPVTKDNGESYLYDYVVDPETVGQYTGLKDRHGQEIYEGDILRDDEMGLNVVRWEDGSFWLEMFYEGNQSLMEHLSDYNEVCEIIGNIYENPELLKGEESECNH
jgi:uncharacterized phage protein (TIGR01671 family)